MNFNSLVVELLNSNFSNILQFQSDPDVLKGIKTFQAVVWPKLKIEIPKINLRFPAGTVNDVFEAPTLTKGTMSDDPTQSEANFNIVLKRKDKKFPTEDLDIVYLQKGLKVQQDEFNKIYFNSKEVVNILEPHPSHERSPEGITPELFIPVVVDIQALK